MKLANHPFDDREQPLRLRDAGFSFNAYWRFDKNSPLRRIHDVSIFQGRKLA
jgi:hypothetical protein|tara:strand:- start:138 stop:293 length:156 start_codon:yes stop_codon:yes gene_type:complete